MTAIRMNWANRNTPFLSRKRKGVSSRGVSITGSTIGSKPLRLSSGVQIAEFLLTGLLQPHTNCFPVQSVSAIQLLQRIFAVNHSRVIGSDKNLRGGPERWLSAAPYHPAWTELETGLI